MRKKKKFNRNNHVICFSELIDMNCGSSSYLSYLAGICDCFNVHSARTNDHNAWMLCFQEVLEKYGYRSRKFDDSSILNLIQLINFKIIVNKYY